MRTRAILLCGLALCLAAGARARAAEEPAAQAPAYRTLATFEADRLMRIGRTATVSAAPAPAAPMPRAVASPRPGGTVVLTAAGPVGAANPAGSATLTNPAPLPVEGLRDDPQAGVGPTVAGSLTNAAYSPPAPTAAQAPAPDASAPVPAPVSPAPAQPAGNVPIHTSGPVYATGPVYASGPVYTTAPPTATSTYIAPTAPVIYSTPSVIYTSPVVYYSTPVTTFYTSYRYHHPSWWHYRSYPSWRGSVCYPRSWHGGSWISGRYFGSRWSIGVGIRF